MEQARYYFESDAVFLIGSFARGDQNDLSDIDILLITQSAKPLSGFYKQLHCDFNKKLISIIRYPFHIFQKHWNEGSLFSYHLIKEAKIHYKNDPVSNFMQSPFFLKESFYSDIDFLGKRLVLYEKENLFDKSSIYFSSQLFLHLKNIAMFKLADINQVTFNKWYAYNWLVERGYCNQNERRFFDVLKNAYLHIYKKQSYHEKISVDDFAQLVKFVRKVHNNVQDTF